MKHNFRLKVLISAGALILIAGRLVWPNIAVDTVFLVLAILAVLPWLSSFVESAEFPGGWKVKFWEVKSAGEKITLQQSEEPSNIQVRQPSYLTVAERDPNLALVGLRIEIEKRLRALGAKHGLPSNQPAMHLIRALGEKGVLDDPSTNGLQDLLQAGNRAAHGAEVEQEVANWAFDNGPKILVTLDGRLTEEDLKDHEEWLKKAITILDFEGLEFTSNCITLLSMAKRDGQIMFKPRYTLKTRAAETLIKLGALRVDEDESSTSYNKYRITTIGSGLLSHLLAR